MASASAPAKGDASTEDKYREAFAKMYEDTLKEFTEGSIVPGTILEIRSNEVLVDIGGRVHAAPITFAVDGRQYVTIAAGNALYAFSLKDASGN